MARAMDFNWEEADLVIHPVQAVVAYPGQNGVVIRQQRSSDRDRDDVINIPHHAVDRLIHRLQLLQNSSVISMEQVEHSELVEIFAAE